MPKGGMCHNPYGGNSSLNHLDDEFMEAIFQGRLSPYQALSLRIIKMSVRDYLYFGLGANHITPERFLEAYQYLFQMRSTQVQRKEVKEKCFDVHYDISGLSDLMPIEKFLKLLLTKRTKVLTENHQQIKNYLKELRSQEWNRLKIVTSNKGSRFSDVERMKLLAEPLEPRRLAKLLLYTRVFPKKPKAEVKSKLQYKSLLF